MSVVAETPPAVTSGPSVRLWHVGSLFYTRGRLVNVFAWMLWGDLCIVIGETVVLRLVPMQLQSLGATNAAIGIVTGSVFSLMNWIMNPIISTASDRCRSPLGRRMPFMLYTALPIALFLASFAYSPQIGRYLHAHAPSLAGVVEHLTGKLLPGCGALAGEAQLTIAMIALVMVLFRFFDLFPQCVYYYLFTDVIPQSVMGTFVCLFGVTSTIGTILFHSWLLPYAGEHMAAIYVGSAAMFFITFTLLPFLVKEGTYPPPTPRPKGRPIKALVGWLREVFSLGFYWRYFLTYSASRWAFTPFNLFLIVYAQKKLGLGPSEFGHLMGVVLLVQTPALFLLGPLLDKYHPTRVGIFGFALMAISAAWGFFFIQDRGTFIGCTIVAFVAVAIIQGSMSTLGPRMLPPARYGQFCAANSMVSETGMLFFAYACGTLLDHLGQRYLFAWMAGFGVFGLVMIISLYRAWLSRGGDTAYTPPAVCPVV